MRKNEDRVTERSIRFPDTLYLMGMRRADELGITFSELIRELLRKETSNRVDIEGNI